MAMKIHQQGGVKVDTALSEQINYVVLSSLKTMVIFVICFHFLIYILYFFNKRFVSWYMKVLGWTGSVSAFLIGFTSTDMGFISYYLIFQGFFYFYNVWGLKYFPILPKAKT